MSLQLCRICGNKDDLVNILEQGPALLEKLSKCANIVIKVDDFLPKFICQQCDHMLDMSYKLRRQSETMQEKLQHELSKREVAEVHYISDDENTKTECQPKEVNPGIDSYISLDNEQKASRASCNVKTTEEFMVIEHDSIDTKTESTVLASETEDTNEKSQAIKPTKLRPVSPDDIESNVSYDIPLTKNFGSTNDVNKIPENDVIDEEVVDIGDMNDEYLQRYDDASTNSLYGAALEFCSVDIVSNPELATPDLNHDEFEVESRSYPYTCVTCNEDFSRKKDYQDHIQQHGASRYQCIQCLAYFPTRYRLVRHEATHKDVIASHDCPHCKRQYSLEYNLKRHIKTCHSKVGKYHCDICQMSYARQDALKRHVLQIHTNKKWHCKACGASFRSAHLLNIHKTTSECADPAILANILKQPLPPEYIVQCSDNRYKCVHCNALFKTLWTYRNHLLIHEDIRPFPCTTCDKSFRTRYALINHERIHNNEKPFKCDFCARSFRQVTHLKHHRYQHTKDDMPFTCTKCKMGFVTKWKLRDHLRKHFTEKAFKCAECPEEFFLKYDLKRHARLVHCRSVDIVDSDNEGNQNQLDFIEGTTETDKTDDERYITNEMEDVIDIIDDDDDDVDGNESSNSVNENLLVLNEAEPSSLGDIREATSKSNINVTETLNRLNPTEETSLSHTSVINMHSKDANEPQVHFINFGDEDSIPDYPSDNTNKLIDVEKEIFVNYIDLEEGTSAQSLNVRDGVSNERDLDIIHLDEEEEEEEVLTPPPPPPNQALSVEVANESAVDFVNYEEKDSKSQYLLTTLQTSENPKISDNTNAPGVSNEKVIDYIHLDSSNSCHSPPRHCNNGYFDNIIEGEEQEEYDTITEEKIHITEEKIETYQFV